MTSASSLPSEAARYLRQVEQSLQTLSPEDRSEIVAEIHGHLLEKLASGGSQAVRDSLAAFGTAESYASAFVEDANIRSALASRSVGGMFVQSLKLAGRGVTYFLTSLIVVLLFAFAVALAILSILKAVIPGQVGFWTFANSDSFVVGFLDETSRAGALEHLGYWIIPLGLAAGLALFSLANFIMRRTLSSWVHGHHSLAHNTNNPPR
jgi:uncharacterized membrane protein